MRNRAELILKIACAILGAALVFHLVLVVVHSNPLAKVTIPAVPSLTTATNAPAAAKGTPSNVVKAVMKNSTNVQSRDLVKAGLTNPAVTMPINTNSDAPPLTVKSATNSVTQVEPAKPVTHSVVPSDSTKVETATNAQPSLVAQPPQPKIEITATVVHSESNRQGTNLGGTHTSKSVTNLMTLTASGTNVTLRSPSGKPSGPGSRPDMAMMGMPGMPGAGGKKLPELAPAIKARIDRIYESELLGQVMRPMPMALLGIAGNSAFLRSPSGQTGLVKEGDSLGEMKLIRIGINRVLVEEGGQKKELMLFNGYGSESLLKKETPDETTPK